MNILFILSVVFLCVAIVMSVAGLALKKKDKKNPGSYSHKTKEAVSWTYLLSYIAAGILSICDKFCS